MEESLMSILNISTNRITELSNEAKQFCDLLKPVSPEDSVIVEAEVNASKLEGGLEKLKNDLNNYFRLVNDPAVDDISRISTSQLEAEESLRELRVRLKRCKPSPSSSRDNGPSVAGKLPKMNLPEFHGDILQWNQFWDQFTSLVDSRKLNDVDKLMYLVSSLRGEAKKLIEGLGTTNKNYSIAVTTLKARYGRIEMVKDAHYSALNKIKPAENSTVDCRRVLNDVEKHLRVLSSLGESTTHSYLRFLILEKFPEEIVYELKKRIREDSVLEIRKELENLISAKEDANRLTTQKGEGNQDRDENHYTTEAFHVTERKTDPRVNNSYPVDRSGNARGARGAPASGFLRPGIKRKYNDSNNANSRERTQTGIPWKKGRWSCLFCNGSHRAETCKEYPTVKGRKLRLAGRCYRCFKGGHREIQCRNKRDCSRCGSRFHHMLLCPRVNTGMKGRETSDSSSIQKEKNPPKTCPTKQFHVNDGGFTILQTAIVDLAREDEDNDCIKCRALLDSGSQRTYITQSLAKKLNLVTIEETRLTIFTFGSQVPQEVNSPRVKFQIVTRSGKTILMVANVVPMITHSVPYVEPDKELWKAKFDLADDGSLADRVDLLIGNDYYFTVMLTERIKIQKNLHIVNSELGWIISGKADLKPADELTVVTYFQTSLEVRLNQPDMPLSEVNLKELWELEAIGITDSPKESREEEAIRHFNETTRIENDRYQVSWPWVEYPPDLEPNFGLALGRLVGLTKRLDSGTLMSYDQLLRDQRELGIIEVVPDEEISSTDHPVHYLPHHCVKQANKPIRIVYDASSKTKDNKSLNQCLYCGPMMLEDLTGLLLKFRSHNIGICADVEKAFLQIGLQNKDRDVTRFLWIKDIEQPVNNNNLLHLRFCRVPFGVISSPFLLNATIKYHLSRSSLENVRHLAQDIYVDNMVTGTDTAKEAIDLYKNSKQAFQQMSMNLREWSSNSSEFLNRVPDSCQDTIVKVLGLNWNLADDTLHLRIKENEYANTKRGVLRCIASVYDPCGYAAPLMLPAKILLQDLWKLKSKWDTPLSKELKEKWEDIRKELKILKEICVPRCYMEGLGCKNYQIHCFTDASMKAYAAVIYLVQDNVRSFVIGKSRLVPTKDHDDLKIPRLELLAALIGHRLIQYVMRSLQGNISQQILWTDSQIVISWYYSDKLLTPFVARRIQEMKKNKELQLRYVPTDLNPADVATRPTQSKEDVERWLTGPNFLTQHPAKWPASPVADTSLLAGEGLANTSMEVDDKEEQEEATGSKKATTEDIGIIYTTVSEIKNIQSKHFAAELAGKQTHLKRNLDLFMDEDGILRTRGRFKYANWTYDKRYPILLPKDSQYTDEIIMKTHTDNYHVGATHTLSIIRQSFWIPQGKRQVLKVINRCAQCIKHGGGPFKLPPTPALPPERVNYSEAFTFTGMDYLGPITVKTMTGTDKRWICLFTCLAVRAVHLEVIQNLTAEEGLLALRRFTATRNVPTLITSDNATNFKLMSEVLTQPYCVKNKITWRFIPQLAPWFGGFYERLIGLVKNCMRKTLQKHLLTDNQLSTIVKEIEAVINSRPLTYVNEEPTHILKPSDFLAHGRTITIDTHCDGPLPQGSQVKKDLVSSWKRGITVLDEFKDMFVNRYLLSLRERYSHSHKQPRHTSKLEPSVGQTVQIKGDSKNREDWKVGKIVELPKGSDNMCRVAKVEADKKVYTRSIAQLYPLEVEDTEGDEVDASYDDKEENSNDFETDVDADAICISPTHEKGEQELPDDTESVDKEITPLRVISPESIEVIGTNADDTTGASLGPRPPRDAAVRAREKIRRWTRSLMSLLSAVGSVANV